jgi:hypothetical protein
LVAGLVVFGVLNLRDRVRDLRKFDTRQGAVMSAADYRVLPFLNTTVKQGEYVFVYPYAPIYYYLAALRNPTRYSVLLYGYNTPAQFDEVIRDIETKHVRYVLDMGASDQIVRGGFPGYHQPPADQLKLERYLDGHYEAVGWESGFRILRRRDVQEKVASASLLNPARGAGNR